MDVRRIATITGWLWIVTFVTSIPARFIFYVPVLEDGKDYVLGQGNDAMTLIAFGALLELILIIANIGTAVVPYPIHKRVNEAGGYVTARVMECVFIAVGILCMLAISTLRQDAPAGLDSALGQGLEAVYEWSFRLGPGFVVGVGNGLILGWLMYKSELVPRGLAMFGPIGGPLIIIAGVLVMFDVIEGAGLVQGLMSIPEAFWELSQRPAAQDPRLEDPGRSTQRTPTVRRTRRCCDHRLSPVKAHPSEWSRRVTVPVRRGGLLSLVAPIPPATISFHATARVHTAGSPEVAPLLKELAPLLPTERRSTSSVIEIVPEGRFVTYGIGVPLRNMRDPDAARARVPVM
jgi:hypothetical protein